MPGIDKFGRAIGETMIVLMASGNAAIISTSFLDSVRTFSATIAAELAEVVFGSGHLIYHKITMPVTRPDCFFSPSYWSMQFY